MKLTKTILIFYTNNKMGANIREETQIIEKQKERLKHPDMYRVIMHNDDYTTMEFVVEILTRVFQKSRQDAMDTMLKIHKGGKATVGVYTYDIATSKVKRVHDLSAEFDFPLRCSVVPDN